MARALAAVPVRLRLWAQQTAAALALLTHETSVQVVVVATLEPLPPLQKHALGDAGLQSLALLLQA